MPRVAAADSLSTARLHTIDAFEVDLLESLEARDRSLYAIVSAATRYRALLHEQIQLLRAGKDPEIVRVAINRWDEILREIGKLAEKL
jgi:hypothetical protein